MSDYLMHYGVKGMHWGVRRGRKRGALRESMRRRKAERQQNLQMIKDFNSKFEKQNPGVAEAINKETRRSIKTAVGGGLAASGAIAVGTYLASKRMPNKKTGPKVNTSHKTMYDGLDEAVRIARMMGARR